MGTSFRIVAVVVLAGLVWVADFALDTWARQNAPAADVSWLGASAHALPQLLLLAAVAALLGAGILFRRERDALRREREFSETRFKLAFDTSPDSININRLHDGLYVDTNQGFHSLTGYTKEEVIGRTSAEIDIWADPGDRERLVEGLRKNGSVENLEAEFRAKDGSTKTCLMSARVIQIGDVPHILSVTRDISDRKHAEAALRESEDRLNTILENVGAHIFIKDTDYRYTYVNRKACELLGLPPEEILGRDDADLFSPASAEEIRRSDLPVLEQGATVRREEPDLTAGDGVARTYWTVKLPLRDDAGRVSGLCGISTDITDRKRTEEALRDRNRYIETILENAPIGFAVNTMDHGEIVFVSSRFEEIYGLPRGSVRSVSDFFEQVYRDPDFRARMKARIMADVGTGDPARMRWEDIPIVTASGDERFVTATNIPLPDQNLMVSTVQDVTARRRAERVQEHLQIQLAQAQKMESIGRLAGGVAHDFNNVLTVILGHAEMAQAAAEAPPAVRAHLAAIEGAAEHSAELTRQLLAFARKQTVEPVVLDLNETVEGMLKMLRRLIGEDIDLDWRPDADLWPVEIDPSQVHQLLANLCVNARDAIADEGKIAIETRNVRVDEAPSTGHAELLPGAYVLLSVSDDGCGMDRAVLDHLFEPFFTTKATGSGTGLGLATVYGIVKQNHGFIDVYSEPGQGSTFRIYLSRATGETAATKAVRTTPPRGRGETVLLVEDDKAILNLGQSMLEALGYRVLAANGPTDALRRSEDHDGEIHLLLTDVVMPEMNGRVLAERLAALRPGLPCLFVSGYPADVIADHGVLDAGIRFLAKPFSFQELAEKVREVLDLGSEGIG